MYHVSVHSLAQRVLNHIRRQELLHAGDRIGVAVSGGIDSVALLRLLLELRGELGIVLFVVHFNHKLRGAESDADQEFVAGLAHQHELEFFCDSDDVAQHAAEKRASLETAARELRYGFFRFLLGEGRDSEGLNEDIETPTQAKTGLEWGTRRDLTLNKIVTAHTLDDQAETVLMRLIRGAGLTGLGGIHPRIEVEDDDGELCGEIVRPLLAFRRHELEGYLKDIGQSWREDSTNADSSFTRNRVRQLLVPLLENEFNPRVAENLSELAEIARGEEDYWENEIAGWMGTTVHWSEPKWAQASQSQLVQIASGSLAALKMLARDDIQSSGQSTSDDLQSKIDNAPWLVANASVSRAWFLGEPIAVQRRLVKAIGERAGIALEFKHVEEILRFAEEDGKAGKELSLPHGWKLKREHDELLFVTPDLRKSDHSQESRDYEYLLVLPGCVAVREIGISIEARRISADEVAAYNPDQLLDADSLPGTLRVRNWRAGDRFWPAHTKSEKKVKELLQERHVAQPERGLWPIIVSGDEIVWMRGFPTPAKRQHKAGRDTILILEKRLGEDFAE
jgi:tRNA(Ile)-lysidine synthase